MQPTTMTAYDLTKGQLERILVQRIQNFYQRRIGQRPAKATCQLFDDRIAIILEQTISAAEQSMINIGREDLASKWRKELHEALKPELKAIVEDVTDTPVMTVMIDSDLATGFSCVAAVLAHVPAMPDFNTISKANSKKLVDSDKN
jgi:uncharacterized protein YbcI